MSLTKSHFVLSLPYPTSAGMVGFASGQQGSINIMQYCKNCLLVVLSLSVPSNLCMRLIIEGRDERSEFDNRHQSS